MFGGPPAAAVGRHTCVAEYINAELHRGVYEGVADQMLLRADMCVAKQTNSRLHPRSKAGHVLDQTRVEPTDQGLQRFGRATDDVSIHMCVAE